MKIAICDDEQVFVEKISEKIQQMESDCEITVFTSSIALINSNEPWDIVFLDIEMEEMNGFQTAEVLKQRLPDCILAFVTTHHELAVDGYDYQPFRYILKQVPEPVIERKMQETLWEYHRRNKKIKTSYKGAYRTILISDIQWIEITGHCLKIKVEDEIILWHKPLEQIEQELKAYGVIRCHRSFMVALGKIRQIKAKTILLNNGDSVPVGRTYRKQTEEQYLNYTLKK